MVNETHTNSYTGPRLSHENEKLPNICVVGVCSNVTDTEKGISLHFIPFQWRRDARSEKETG